MDIDNPTEIEKKVARSSHDFSFVEKMVSFVNNLEFKKGYEFFRKGQDNQKAHIWDCLSAIGDDLGEIIYANVVDYVDYVSNVDLCKVKSLRSMMKNLGFNYTIFDNMDEMPIEIINLMDVLSINKKYLLNSDYIRQDLIDDLKQKEVAEHTDVDISAYYCDFRNNFEIRLSTDLVPSPSATKEIVDGIPGEYRFTQDYGYSSRSDDGLYDPELNINILRVYEKDDLSVVKFYSKSEERSESDGEFYTDYYGILAREYDRFHRKTDRKFIGITDDVGFEYSVGVDGKYHVISDVFDYEKCSGISGLGIIDESFFELNSDRVLETRYDSQDVDFQEWKIDDDKYRDYITSIYNGFIMGVLTSKYNIMELGDSDLSSRIKNGGYVFLDVVNGDDYKEKNYISYDKESVIRNKKVVLGIATSFDQDGIVDDIEKGYDSIDNYSQNEQELLNYVIEQRKQQLDDSNVYFHNSDILSTDYNKTQNTTRYSYYRYRKVLDFAKFVDNKFFNGLYDLSSISSDTAIYGYDVNYNDITNAKYSRCLSVDSEITDDVGKCINRDMVAVVSKYLTDITLYIVKLREKIKLQAKKNYMKGTNNLLTYVVNEFLVDYSKFNTKMFNGDTNSNLSVVRGYLSSHNATDIVPIEYYDETDYYNLSTETSNFLDSGTEDIKERFWQSVFEENLDGLTFKMSEIENFYLSTLGMKTDNTPLSTSVKDILSVVYDTGANSSYFNGDMFTVLKLSAVQTDRSIKEVFTDDLYKQLVELSTTWEALNDTYLSAGDYEYPDDTIENQISDMVENYIWVNLSNEYLSGISSVYDDYVQSVNSLSNQINILVQNYESFLSGLYPYYYEKSDCMYCYDNYDISGYYKHDWFIDHPEKYNATYIRDRLNECYTFSMNDENIHHYPLIDTIDYLCIQFDAISTDLVTSVINGIEEYGYNDIHALTINGEMDDAYDWLKEKIDQRYEFLKNLVEGLKTQANALLDTYNSTNNSFTQAVANYDDGNQFYSLTGGTPIYCCSLNSPPTKEAKEAYEGSMCNTSSPTGKSFYWKASDVVNGVTYYWGGTEKNKGNRAFISQGSPGYSAGGSLESRCASVDSYMNTPTSFMFVVTDSESGAWEEQYNYGLMNEGMQSALDSATQSVSDMRSTVQSIVRQLEMIGFDYDGVGTHTDILSEINGLIEFVNAEVDETWYEKDKYIIAYRGFQENIINLSATYIPVKEVYDSINTTYEYSTYLGQFVFDTDFTMGGMKKMSKYINETDSDNRKDIKARLNGFVETYNQIYDDYISVAEVLAADEDTYKRIHRVWDGVEIGGHSEKQYVPYTGVAEEAIYNMYNFLVNDVIFKDNDAVDVIEWNKDVVLGYIDVISSQIPTYLSTYEKFDERVEKRIQELNFLENETYLYKKELYKTYSGGSNGYDPYYNHKNIQHSSYQLHPFLWNFIEVQKYHKPISIAFDSKTLEELEGQNALNYINKYFGEYGQSIDVWKHNLVDYTGYVTRYETSEHTLDSTFSEVVDYDGAFYPPAIQDFRSDPSRFVKSVRYNVTTEQLIYRYREDIKVCFDDLAAELSSVDQVSSQIVDILEGHYDDSIVSTATPEDVSACFNLYSDCVIGGNLSDVIAAWFGQFTEEDTKDRTYRNLFEYMRSNLQKSSYERYYSHLGLKDNERVKIADRLEEYKYDIFNITDRHTKSEVWDIFKYGLDVAKNAYILYKLYDYGGEDDPTYRQKQNTPGEIWIRLCDHPIAFPALYGENPALDGAENMNGGNNSLLHKIINHYSDPSGSGKNFRRTDRHRCFFDFELTKSGKGLVLFATGEQAAEGVQKSRFGKFNSIERPVIILSNVLSETDDITGHTLQWVVNNSGSSVLNQEDMLEYAKGENDTDRDKWYYVGKYDKDNTSVCLLFMKKGVLDGADKLTPDLGSVIVYRYRAGVGIQGSQTTKIDTKLKISRTDFDSDQVIMSEYNNFITFAFLVRNGKTVNSCLQGQIDIEDDATGATITDPTTDEVNTFDTFVNTAYVVTCKNKSSGQLKLYDERVYNTNADMSYVPIYSVAHGIADIYGKEHGTTASSTLKISHDDVYTLELLGESKNIDKEIGMINTNADPNFDYDKILKDYTFGRVYEDFDINEDKSLISFTNPILNNWYTNEITWQINLQSKLAELGRTSKYTADNYKDLKLIVYNKDNLGHNPYFVCDLEKMACRSAKEYLNVFRDAYYNESGVGSTGYVDTKEFNEAKRCGIIGTKDVLQKQSEQTSNHIRNISSIKANFYEVNDVLTIKFIVDDGVAPGDAFIARGSIEVVLYNPKDLSMFKYYHMLDQYGMVCSQYRINYLSDYYLIKDPPGYGVFYDISHKPDDYFLPSYKSCTFRKDGKIVLHSDSADKTLYLEDINLEDYDFLSDVYVLKGHDRLQYKMEESFRADIDNELYYYPTLNIKYPKIPGNYIKPGKMFNVQELDTEDGFQNLDVMDGLFSNKNVYVFKVDSGEEVAKNIGHIDVPITIRETESYRVFEDYYDDSGNGESYSERYDIADPRTFHFVKFTENGLKDGTVVEVDDDYIKDIDDNQLLNNASLSGLFAFRTEDVDSDVTSEYVGFDFDPKSKSNVGSLDDILRIYVNFNKEMTLYFNYNNFLRSPYIRQVDGNTLIDTIDGTYLKLKKGDNGILNVIVQFRYLNGNTIYGYKNATVVSYRIYNLSDDKPKFLIQRISMIEKDSLSKTHRNGTVKMTLPDITYDLAEFDETQRSKKIDVDFIIGVNSDKTIDVSRSVFYVNYPETIIEFQSDVDQMGYVATVVNNGVLKIQVTNKQIREIKLSFKTTDTASSMSIYQDNTYMIYVDDDEIYDIDGYLVDFTSNIGSLKFISGEHSYAKTEDSDETNTRIILINTNNLGGKENPILIK